MRILVCSTGFLPAESFGGLPFSTFNLCKGLLRCGADLRVVATDCNGATSLDVPVDCWTSYEGIPVWYAATRGGPFLYAASASAAISDAIPQVDCVINSGTLWSHSGFLSWRAASQHRTPSLTYVRGLLDPWAFRFKRFRKIAYWHTVAKRILRDSTAIVALSESERAVIRRMGVRTRIEVIPNGAALERESESRDWLDARYPELSGRRYVLFLGRIHAKKGLDILLDAIGRLQREQQDVAFVVAGPIDSAYSARWTDLLRSHAGDGVVLAPGAVRGVLKATLLKHAHLFVLPSYGEGLPVAALEALRSGCPVVVTTACNLPEIQEADAGITIEPDAGQLLSAIRSILRDPQRRRRMAENAHVLAGTVFDWDSIARRTLALCQDVVAPRTTGWRGAD